MKYNTLNKYKKVTQQLLNVSPNDRVFSTSDFDNARLQYKITGAFCTLMISINVLTRLSEGKYKFLKYPSNDDFKKIGQLQSIYNSNIRQTRILNTRQMTIETSVPNTNKITTDSDDFAAQAMAYLESRGFKVTKEKLNFPIKTYMGGIRALTGRNKIIDEIGELDRVINQVAKMERDHIYLAYRACESGKYKSPEQYLKDEYNDFTA